MADLKEKWPLLANWKFFFVLLLPIILLPLLFLEDYTDTDGDGIEEPTTKFRCAYVIILMALLWMVEALPLAITSFLPVVLFPLFGVESTSDVAINYMKETNMMFVGGIIIALAVEYSNLHKRIALRVMTLIGSSQTRIMLGVMLTTMGLSMWISNTATTAMMVPIVLAILEELNKTVDVCKPTVVAETEGNHVDGKADQVEYQMEVAFSDPDEGYNGSQRNIVSLSERHLRDGTASSCNDKVMIMSDEDDCTVENGKVEAVRQHHPLKTQLLTCIFVAANIGGTFLPMSGNASSIFYSILTSKKRRLEKCRARQKKMYLFATAYASNIGGTGVVTGTSPNLVLMQLLKPVNVSQNGKYFDLTFASWMAYNVPTMLLNVLIAWIYLILTFIGVPDAFAFWRKKRSKADKKDEEDKNARVQKLLDREYEALGPMTFHEIAVAILFFFVVMLWLFRDPRFIEGWGHLFPLAEVEDSTSAMLVVFMLFVIPRDPSFLFGKPSKLSGALLDWKYVQAHLPWGVVLLMGGGFAISDAATKSSLSIWIGEQLYSLNSLSNEGILIICMILTAAVTEVASNSATASVIVPILLSLSKRLDLHPLYLTLPSVVTCSFAFMLPVATPPNAIVYAAATEEMRIMDMVKTGAFLNFSCTLILFFMHLTYGNLLFDFGNYSYDNNSTITTL